MGGWGDCEAVVTPQLCLYMENQLFMLTKQSKDRETTNLFVSIFAGFYTELWREICRLITLA